MNCHDLEGRVSFTGVCLFLSFFFFNLDFYKVHKCFSASELTQGFTKQVTGGPCVFVCTQKSVLSCRRLDRQFAKIVPGRMNAWMTSICFYGENRSGLSQSLTCQMCSAHTHISWAINPFCVQTTLSIYFNFCYSLIILFLLVM